MPVSIEEKLQAAKATLENIGHQRQQQDGARDPLYENPITIENAQQEYWDSQIAVLERITKVMKTVYPISAAINSQSMERIQVLLSGLSKVDLYFGENATDDCLKYVSWIHQWINELTLIAETGERIVSKLERASKFFEEGQFVLSNYLFKQLLKVNNGKPIASILTRPTEESAIKAFEQGQYASFRAIKLQIDYRKEAIKRDFVWLTDEDLLARANKALEVRNMLDANIILNELRRRDNENNEIRAEEKKAMSSESRPEKLISQLGMIPSRSRATASGLRKVPGYQCLQSQSLS